MEALVGYTGFVGSNLASEHGFDALFNSSNIGEAYGLKPDLLIYAGVRSEKFVADKFPEKDYEGIKAAMQNIEKIAPRKLVLISTVDVYGSPRGADELTPIETEGLKPYGLNRLRLERWAEENVKDCTIVRLPGLYGLNLKKNFIFDMINRIPSMLTGKKLGELDSKCPGIGKSYKLDKDGFYRLAELGAEDRRDLLGMFRKAGFTSVQFTDSRAVFQFYNLAFLWKHIEHALDEDIRLLNLVTDPVGAGALYEHIFNERFENELIGEPPHYDLKTVNYDAFGGSAGYMFDSGFVIDDVRKFVREAMGQ